MIQENEKKLNRKKVKLKGENVRLVIWEDLGIKSITGRSIEK